MLDYETAERQFWSRVERLPASDGGCWVWRGPVCKAGFGVHRWAGKQRLVHRLAFELLSGEFAPPRMAIVATCGDRLCVNHLTAQPWTTVLGRGHTPNRNNCASLRRGVYPTPTGRWVAQIKLQGRSRHLGTYDTIDEADAAVRAARAQLFGTA